MGLDKKLQIFGEFWRRQPRVLKIVQKKVVLPKFALTPPLVLIEANPLKAQLSTHRLAIFRSAHYPFGKVTVHGGRGFGPVAMPCGHALLCISAYF